MADESPYWPPGTFETSSDNDTPQRPRNRMAQVGFWLSYTSLLGGFAVGFVAALQMQWLMVINVCCVGLSLPGIIISGISLIWAPRRQAVWGIVLGILPAANLPTLLLPWWM